MLDKTIEKQERRAPNPHDLTGGDKRKKSKVHPDNWSIPAHTRTSSLSRMGHRNTHTAPQSVTSRPSSPSVRSTISSASGPSQSAISKIASSKQRKDTSHPRGRGGGVPLKPPASAPSTTGERGGSRLTRIESSDAEHGFTPTSGKKSPEMMVWTGLGKPPSSYGGMENVSLN